MKKSIFKVALLLLCSAFVLSSCSKDGGQETVTMKYRITMSGDANSMPGSTDGIGALYIYIQNEMQIAKTENGKSEWGITKTADTKEVAIEACDKEAQAIFDEKLSALNAATQSIKTKFEEKKLELASKIALDPSSNSISITNYGGNLQKYDGSIWNLLDEGESVELNAVGGAAL